MAMSDLNFSHKIRPQHLARRAVVYLRQSSDKQVRHNKESQRLQYGLRDRSRELGWREIEVLDVDLGRSASLGAARLASAARCLRSAGHCLHNTIVAAVASIDLSLEHCQAICSLTMNPKPLCFRHPQWPFLWWR